MILLDANASILLDTSVVSIGVFDGVHRGHRQLLAQLRAQGRRLGLPTVVLTFDPHPRSVLRVQAAPHMISRLDKRLELLADTGDVDYCLVLPFDRQRSNEPVERFVQDTLVDSLGMRALVVGENFVCGKNRRGDTEYLREMGKSIGFEVQTVPMLPTAHDEWAVSCSSSVTRRLIQTGDLHKVTILLDRPHELPCTVTTAVPEQVTEAKLPEDLCTPPVGSYTGEVRFPGKAACWVRTQIQVREALSGQGCSVRIQSLRNAIPGDSLYLRFLEKV